jgi:hypothetical protein
LIEDAVDGPSQSALLVDELIVEFACDLLCIKSGSHFAKDIDKIHVLVEAYSNHLQTLVERGVVTADEVLVANEARLPHALQVGRLQPQPVLAMAVREDEQSFAGSLSNLFVDQPLGASVR